MAKQENKVTLQMVDSGGPHAALHIYIQGDHQQGAGRMATFMLAALMLEFADKGDAEFGNKLPQEVKDMIVFHMEKQHDKKADS